MSYPCGCQVVSDINLRTGRHDVYVIDCGNAECPCCLEIAALTRDHFEPLGYELTTPTQPH